MNWAAGDQQAELTGSICSAASCLCQLKVQWITFLLLLSARLIIFHRSGPAYTSTEGGKVQTHVATRALKFPSNVIWKGAEQEDLRCFYSTWLGGKQELTTHSTPQVHGRNIHTSFYCTFKAGYKPITPEVDFIFFFHFPLFSLLFK